jgi:hypothetical protein
MYKYFKVARHLLYAIQVVEMYVILLNFIKQCEQREVERFALILYIGAYQ